MTAQQLWERSGLTGNYEAWAFSEAPDKLAELVLEGVKTATCSAYDLYGMQNEPLPQAGEYSVILNAAGDAVCVIRTTRVYVAEFKDVSAAHAFREGEGDRSLAYWREIHEAFLTGELAAVNRTFSDQTKVVCEEFEVVYPFADRRSGSE